LFSEDQGAMVIGVLPAWEVAIAGEHNWLMPQGVVRRKEFSI
jgi:hypothetical protein